MAQPATRRARARIPRALVSFNARLRDELLDGEIFYSLREAQIIIESLGHELRPIIGANVTGDASQDKEVG